MIRRMFVAAILFAMTDTGFASTKRLAPRHFAFKIKTKGGGIVGNVVIEASDVEAAKAKLMKRYPGCTVLSVTEK